MKLRILISLFCLAVAGAIIWHALRNPKNDIDDFYLNLGTELVGIVVTVAVIDALQEARRRRDEARRMAWNVLHELDHAVWVWQGGARELSIDELLQLLTLVQNHDPVPDFTETLLLRIGSRAEHTLNNHDEVAKANKHLFAALERLKPLAGIRDEQERPSNTTIAAALSNATGLLTQALGKTLADGASQELESYRDPSVDAQRWRHFGRPIERQSNAPGNGS